MLDNTLHKKELTIIFLIYVIALAKSLYASRLGFGLLDEGEYLHIGLRILKGDIPYRDFFSYLPPLYNYWNALAFKLFGISAFSPRLLSSITFSFVPVLLYLIARRFSSKVVATSVALAFGFMEAGMERLYYHIFSFGSILSYFVFMRSNEVRIGLLSGFLLGTTTFFRTDIAVQFLLGLTISNIFYHLFRSKKWLASSVKQIVTFGTGFVIPIIGFFFWLKASNAFSQFIRNATGTPAAFLKDQALLFPKPWNIIPKSLSPKDMFASYEASFLYLIVLIYICVLYLLVKNWKSIWKKTPELPTFLLIAIFTTPYILSRPDLGHMVKGGIPAFFIGAYLLERCKKRVKSALLIAPLMLIVVGIAQIFWWSKFFDTKIQTENGIIRTNSQTVKNSTLVSAGTIEKSLSFIKNNSSPGDQVLIVPYMAGLYFLSDRPSRTYVGNIYDSYIPDEDRFVERLKALNIKVVIYDPVNTPPGFIKKLPDFYPEIDQYIMDNFEILDRSPEGWLYMIEK